MSLGQPFSDSRGGPLDRLAAMASFVRIVESGSLSAAARAQGQSLAAVSRQLAQFEDAFGRYLPQEWP